MEISLELFRVLECFLLKEKKNWEFSFLSHKSKNFVYDHLHRKERKI